MGLTPPKWVWPGFFRVHLWVVMGLQTLAALAIYSALNSGEEAAATDSPLPGAWELSIGVAVLSYLGAVVWLYEKPVAGRAILWVITVLALVNAWLCGPWRPTAWATLMDMAGSGWLMGAVTTAMLLGHWYLNSPSMRMEPLRRLVALLAAAVALRALVCGGGWLLGGAPEHSSMLLVWGVFRWAAGIAGPGLMAYMAWQTLKIPNTQSATGILYAAVIVTFLGELVSQLLSANAPFAL